ncbi:MAG: FAD-dependent oxidoreductase, partial [Pseudomonadales bacterium]|nr:FAD-dependent oxidoreductase [Pseudomonadales bacterium]
AEFEKYSALPSPKDSTRGGGSISDNPNRFMYYPSHPVEGSTGGVILSSYTWADDARRWDSMSDTDRYAFALRGMCLLHGERIKLFYTGRGATQSWAESPYAFGEAAVFNAGQMTRLHLATQTIEGPLHFAGEHTSLKHAWVEGSLESACRVALELKAIEQAVKEPQHDELHGRKNATDAMPA